MPPYQSKIARLNVECSDTSLLQDCLPGQKWKCVNEDGRWRKHKCKFHKEVQDHLAEINKYLSAQQSRRNCACFTPNGLVYTKIKADRDVFPQKQKRFDGHRHRNGRYKREADENFEEIFNDKLIPEFESLLQMDQVLDNIENFLQNDADNKGHSRKKREADYITQTIDELHSVLLTLEKKYLNNTKGPVQCFVEDTGKVNCSTIVYENEEAWRQSRIQIDMLIKVLKDKIVNLKDIKRHLKEHRPNNMTSLDDEFYGMSSTEDNFEISSEFDDEDTTKKKHSKHRHHQGANERRRRPKTTSTTTIISSTTEEDTFSSSTTEFDEIMSSSSITPQINVETTSRQPHKTRNRTKASKPPATTIASEEKISSSTQNYEENVSESDFYTSEISPSSKEYDVTSESIISSEISTTSATTTKSTKIQRTTSSENNINNAVNITNSSGTMQAECYCASSFER